MFQRTRELLFFLEQHTFDLLACGAQFRIGIAHLAVESRDQLVEEAATRPQLVTVTHGATDDATQHVATAFVGGQHAIGDQEGTRADVVSHHAQ